MTLCSVLHAASRREIQTSADAPRKTLGDQPPSSSRHTANTAHAQKAPIRQRPKPAPISDARGAISRRTSDLGSTAIGVHLVRFRSTVTRTTWNSPSSRRTAHRRALRSSAACHHSSAALVSSMMESPERRQVREGDGSCIDIAIVGLPRRRLCSCAQTNSRYHRVARPALLPWRPPGRAQSRLR